MKKGYIHPQTTCWHTEIEMPVAVSIRVAKDSDYQVESSEEILVKEDFWGGSAFE